MTFVGLDSYNDLDQWFSKCEVSSISITWTFVRNTNSEILPYLQTNKVCSHSCIGVGAQDSWVRNKELYFSFHRKCHEFMFTLVPLTP